MSRAYSKTALVAAVLLLGVLAACDAGPDTAPDAPQGRSWSTPPIEQNDGLLARRLPRVDYQGGPFLRNPRLITVTFAADDRAVVARLERFGDVITRTGWWREVVDSYCIAPDDCVGYGSGGRHVRLDETLPAAVSDVDVEEFLARAVKAGHLGRLDRNSLLLIYLPGGVTLTDATVSRYCNGGPRAYHRAIELDGSMIPYAVMPRCADEATLTATASHEILEATTNPDPHERGFAFHGGSANAGFTAAGVEPVDPCGLITQGRNRTTESGFTVQRAWSNRAAALGTDPCVPSQGHGPYVALIPRQPTVRLAAIGERATVAVDAASDQAAPTWAISAFDISGRRHHQRCVDLRLNKSTVDTGDRARLSITLVRRPPNDLCLVGLVSTLGTRTRIWPLAVVTR